MVLIELKGSIRLGKRLGSFGRGGFGGIGLNLGLSKASLFGMRQGRERAIYKNPNHASSWTENDRVFYADDLAPSPGVLTEAWYYKKIPEGEYWRAFVEQEKTRISRGKGNKVATLPLAVAFAASA